MDKKSKELFTESIKQSILKHVGIHESQCELLDGFESIIYKAQRGSEPCVLRISHSLHRKPDEIRGEIEWVDFLAQNHISVPKVLPLPSGELLCCVSDEHGGAFTTVCFSWAEGKHHWEYEESRWTPTLFETMGDMTGKMHKLAQSFEFKQPRSVRPHWYEDPDMDISKNVPEGDEVIREKFEAVNQVLSNLDTSPEDYGLIHFDFHGGNFFVQGKNITLFDFDDCQYNFFVADIAMAIFYSVSFDCRSSEDLDKAREFFLAFMKGYSLQNKLDRQWFALIPLLMKQREILLYSTIHRSYDVSHPEQMDDWSRDYMQGRREKILGEEPYVDLDWLGLFDEFMAAEEATELA